MGWAMNFYAIERRESDSLSHQAEYVKKGRIKRQSHKIKESSGRVLIRIPGSIYFLAFKNYVLVQKKLILVIEDHASLRMVEGMFLGKYFDVVTKEDGLGGIIWMSKGNIPDLIVLDLMMPRLNGIEFLINLKSSGIFRNIPVIVVSGDEDKGIINQCYNLGIANYLVKPFSPKNLCEKIQKVLLEHNQLDIDATFLVDLE
jgi:two-component system chemotaxis response regulator CheY